MGQTKSLEIRIAGIGLMALAVVAALVALSMASAFRGAVTDLGRAPAVGSAPDARVSD